MNAATGITLDSNKLKDALSRFSRDRAMLIGGRVQGRGETIERRSLAHGVVVTRIPRGSADDARSAIAAPRAAFDKGPWWADIGSLLSAANSVVTTPRKGHSMFILPRAPTGGSREEPENLRNREPGCGV